ncbi:MAG: exo-alpha-sialidase, partial [Nitrospira sp.]|nr:exo-alpha-sialidase [Nitrospira sp.]
MKQHNRVILLVGTQKGGFLLTSELNRKKWEVHGPFLEGSTVVHMVLDPRDNETIFAATSHLVWGSHLQRSRDFGKTWEVPREGPKFPSSSSLTVNSIWEIKPGREEEPGTFYVGVEPAALFKSEDVGNTWTPVEGLFNHPTRPLWQPAKGGLSLHSIILDPTNLQRMFVGISAGGVFRTDDGGRSWQAMNKGVLADYLPNPFPEAGQCVHKLVAHPKRPEVLYQQNHCGVYRSRSAGSSWEDISTGLPSRYGLPIAVHAHDPDTIYVV